MPTMCNGKELKPETILKQSNSTYMDSELKRNLVLSMSNILNIYETKRKTITGDTITTKKNVQK